MHHASIPIARAPGAMSGRLSRSRRFAPEALGAAVALLIAFVVHAAEPSPDVAWQLWIGHQLRYGARLYIDIIETNPPLWFWMAIPIDWVAEQCSLPSSVVLVGAIGLASALSVVVIGLLLAHIRTPIRAVLLTYAALVLTLMPLHDMGQREHILLIVTFPYIVLAALRYERRTVSPGMTILIGVGAAFGFALKHYFLITPVLIELWLLSGLRGRYRPIRPEIVALGLVALLYAAAVLKLTPTYLSHIVPMLRLAYQATDTGTILNMVRLTQDIWAATLLILLLRPRILAATPLAAAFAVAALGFASAWLIQFKGWQYHTIPTTGCLMMALALLSVRCWRTLPPLAWMLGPTLMTAPLLLSALIGPFRDPSEPMSRAMLVGVPLHASVAIVSEEEAYAWPLTLRRGFFYPSRQYGMWMLHAVIADGRHNPAVARLGRQVVEETAQDYSCAQPVRISFDQHDRGGFDMERYFWASPSFAALMTHYRRVGRYHQFDLFDRIAPFPAPPASACRRGV